MRRRRTYVRGKRLQKGITHSSNALQQRRTNGRRHTQETTETGACDYCNTGRSWKGRRNEKGGKIKQMPDSTSGTKILSWYSHPTPTTLLKRSYLAMKNKPVGWGFWINLRNTYFTSLFSNWFQYTRPVRVSRRIVWCRTLFVEEKAFSTVQSSWSLFQC